MKFMIALSCLLAVASAGYINSGIVGYAGSPAVAYNAPLVSAPHPVPIVRTIAAPLIQSYAAPIAASYGLVSEPRLVDPIAIAAGAPLPTGDTVEVAAAKALHYQAHAIEKSRTLSLGVAPLGLVSEARLVDPIAIAAGAPLPTGDTVEVAAAKALHYQAHAVAKGHLLVKRSPGYLNAGLVAPLTVAAPAVRSLGLSTIGSPLAVASPIGLGYSSIASPIGLGYSNIASPLGYGGLLTRGHIIAKRSPGYLNAGLAGPLAIVAPVRSLGLSTINAPITGLGYSAIGSPLAYGGLVRSIY